ncbi:hypothetical protein ACFMBG_19570 [Leisingera sp. D0M16]
MQDLTAHLHRDPVGHGRRLDLLMGDIDEGSIQATVQLGNPGAGLDPQLGIQVRQRLIQQKGRGTAPGSCPAGLDISAALILRSGNYPQRLSGGVRRKLILAERRRRPCDRCISKAPG